MRKGGEGSEVSVQKAGYWEALRLGKKGKEQSIP